MLRDFRIKSDKKELKANESCQLIVEINDHEEIEGSGGAEFLLFPFEELESSQVVEWKVINGAGTIAGGKNPTVIYTAPADISNYAEGIVEVTLKNVVDKEHPDRPGQSGLVIVRQSIPLLPDEYVKWEYKGNKYVADFYSAGLFNGVMIINGVAINGTIGIGVNGEGTGTYNIGDTQEPGKKSYITGTDYSDPFSSSYYDWDKLEDVYGSGAVTIAKSGAKGEYIEGDFSSTVYPGESHSGKKVTGSFRIKRGI